MEYEDLWEDNTSPIFEWLNSVYTSAGDLLDASFDYQPVWEIPAEDSFDTSQPISMPTIPNLPNQVVPISNLHGVSSMHDARFAERQAMGEPPQL